MSAAKSSNLGVATCKYIGFLDSDDKILPNYLSILLRITDEEKYGIIDSNLITFSNEALEWCQGKYYSAIASDDQMLIRKTEIQVDYLESNNETVAVFGGVKLIDENNIELKEWLTEEQIVSFEEIIMHEHKLYAPTQMLRLDILKGVDGYNPDIFIEDWYMWLKLSQNGKIACISDLLALYRNHDSNSSNNFEKMHQGRIEVLDFFKEHLLYKRALRNIIWINSLELFIADRKIKNFLNLLLIDTKRTLKLSLKNIKKN